MSKFYDDVYKAAVKASADATVEREARAAAKEMKDAIKKAILDAANKGAFSCLLVGVEDLDGTNTVRVSEQTLTSSSGPERLTMLAVGSDVAQAVAEQVEKLDFSVSTHSVGIKRVSWQAEKAEKE